MNMARGAYPFQTAVLWLIKLYFLSCTCVSEKQTQFCNCRNKTENKSIRSKTQDPVDKRRKLNVHKTFRRRSGRLLNVLCTFNLRPVSTGECTKRFKSVNRHTSRKKSKLPGLQNKPIGVQNSKQETNKQRKQ